MLKPHYGDDKTLVQSQCFTLWLWHSQFAMENAIKFGKPSISMGRLYHGELLVITRGYHVEDGEKSSLS